MMMFTAFTCAVLSPLVAGMQGVEPDANRVQAIAAMLSSTPAGLGQPADDRAAWSALAALPAFGRVISEAEATLKTPLPEQPDDLFLEFSRNGNRSNWERVAGQRRGRLDLYALAECLEDQGRFLPALREVLEAVSAERTWVFPAHDASLVNFNKTRTDIDLFSSATGWKFATIDWLLGDRLGAETRQLIHEQVDRRIFKPFRAMILGEQDTNWWITTTNNWNAVCQAGVIGAALTLLPDPADRAFYVAEAEKNIAFFLKGFTPDGYCSEGIGYWNYGYGHFLMLAEMIWQATGGQLDLQRLPAALAPATFGRRTGIVNDVYPAFADCSLNARPSARYMAFLDRKLGLAPQPDLATELAGPSGALPEVCLFSFPNSATMAPDPATVAEAVGLRSWFSDAGILCSRPAPGSPTRLAVALKGGHNGEHHNHNDVGSYVVVVDRTAVLLDPGSEVYTARTFSSRRYESRLLNSYGHAVPVVAGQLQKTGASARGVVLAAEFSDSTDRLALDLKSCYDVPELTRLEREWVYDRTGEGSLSITDTVACESPQTFETALITLGGHLQAAPDRLVVWDYDQALDVAIDTGGQPWELVTEEIVENARAKPHRLAIRLTGPVTAATVRVTVTPHDFGTGTGPGGLLKNTDFAMGSFGWQFASMTSLVPDPLGGEGQVMQIADATKTGGSSATSARYPLVAGQRYELRGEVYGPGQTDGIGLYARTFDAEGKRTSAVTQNGDENPLGSVGQSGDTWKPFSFTFTAPPETVSGEIWIHSYNAAEVTACLRHLALVPAE